MPTTFAAHSSQLLCWPRQLTQEASSWQRYCIDVGYEQSVASDHQETSCMPTRCALGVQLRSRVLHLDALQHLSKHRLQISITNAMKLGASRNIAPS